jgi:hypothetical protein
MREYMYIELFIMAFIQCKLLGLETWPKLFQTRDVETDEDACFLSMRGVSSSSYFLRVSSSELYPHLNLKRPQARETKVSTQTSSKQFWLE